MIGLSGARAIVVDDDEDDALPILKAFAKKGIPTAYFDGNPHGLPSRNQRLSGVRLAVLDMDLVGGGTSKESKASTLAKYLERILSPENGPYAVLAWTNNPDLLDLFEKYVFAEPSIPNPIFAVMLTKAEAKKRGKFDLTLVSAKLEEKLQQVSPFLFVQAWEEKCFAASTEVTNALSDLAVSAASNLEQWRSLWRGQFLQLMHIMAKAAAEKHLVTENCLNSFYSALNPLHADRMESNAAKLSGTLATEPTDILATAKDCDEEQKAKVNTMLHLAFENLEEFSAGNIYTFQTKIKPAWVPSSRQLLDDCMSNKDKEIKRQVAKASMRVLIEVSPTCDHAQKNVRIARFLAGLLVPANLRHQIKGNTGFIWSFGPAYLKPPIAAAPGQYYFYFSARHLITHPLEETTRIKVDARLRSQALANLQAWLAHQTTRPGMMLLR